ncbi:MAG: T9SS type A sorting domain-containing protein, partial [Bacteroidales bacterium]|nr:T9SS type A sorting domain-containing protein [Bacteroidales bacterium]
AESAFGGGVYIVLNGIIKNNTIENNYCYNAGTMADGGGIEVDQIPGSLIEVAIINNIINNNELECNRSEGAGIMIIGAKVQVLNNIISNNYNSADGFSLGAGFMCRSALDKITIINNTISNNSGTISDNVNVGSGICILGAFDVEFVIDANLIINNVAYHGGGFYERSSYNILFTNNIFWGNSADRGAAVGIFHPDVKSHPSFRNSKSYCPRIINNTFFDNNADDHGGAIRYNGYLNTPIIFNCIFRENTAPAGPDVYNSNVEELIISYSDINTGDIYGNWNGEENINVDPEFIDPENGDFHIDKNSPCTGAGINTIEINGSIFYCPSIDFENDPRPMPFTAMPDMGADEVDETVGIYEFSNYHSSISINIYPNPFKITAEIEFNIPQASYVKVSVVDFIGKGIQTLLSKHLPAGTYQFEWNTKGLTEGIYFVHMKTKNSSVVRKVMILK